MARPSWPCPNGVVFGSAVTLKDFYPQELANLRELGVAFYRDNLALATMLAAKGDDPDVERLLEGVAFLSGPVRRQLS